jgi:hypothetical protein
MNEQRIANVATGCTGHGHADGRGQAERSHAGRPLVTGRPQHGAGVADTPQPTRGQAPCAHHAKTNVGSIRPAGGGSLDHQRTPGKQESMAPVGCVPRDADAAVRTEGEATEVGTPISTGSVLQLVESQRYACALTGRALTPETAALDHIVPVRFGGEHVIENAQVLHKDVNRAKGSLTRAEFIDLCREVVAWTGRARSREVQHGK